MSFFNELKRRNIFKVAIAYAVASWLILQIVDLVLENINAPDWVMQVFMLGLAVGFPIAIIIAWAFEVTPDGVRLEKNVDRSRSITRHTGHQLNRGIIMILSVSVVFLLTERFRDEASIKPEETAGTIIQVNEPVAADKALATFPQSTEALIINANYNETHCNIAEAARLFETAITFNPEDPTAHHWYAILLHRTGRIALALEHINIARHIDPLISAVIGIEAEIYTTLGDYAKAEELQREASTLGLYGGSLHPLGLIYLYAGERDKGKALLEQGRAGEDPAQVFARHLFLQALDDPEKQTAFEKHIGKAVESQQYTTTKNMEYLVLLGSAYAFDYQSDVQCVISGKSIWAESFRKQRKTPEFFELMERAGIVEYWREFGWPDDCASMDQTLAECK